MNDISQQSMPLSDKDARTWAVIVHLSQFLGYLIPLAGFVVPIVIWQIKKDTVQDLDKHGRIVTNWIITSFIYWIVCFVLMFLLIGIPLLYVLGVINVIFPIVGAFKANEGTAWKYPGSLYFFKL